MRFKQRMSFVYKNFSYDFTKVWEGKTLEAAKVSRPMYEIELECIDTQGVDTAYLAQSLLVKCSDLLKAPPKKPQTNNRSRDYRDDRESRRHTQRPSHRPSRQQYPPTQQYHQYPPPQQYSPIQQHHQYDLPQQYPVAPLQVTNVQPTQWPPLDTQRQFEELQMQVNIHNMQQIPQNVDWNQVSNILETVKSAPIAENNTSNLIKKRPAIKRNVLATMGKI